MLPCIYIKPYKCLCADFGMDALSALHATFFFYLKDYMITVNLLFFFYFLNYYYLLKSLK